MNPRNRLMCKVGGVNEALKPWLDKANSFGAGIYGPVAGATPTVPPVPSTMPRTYPSGVQPHEQQFLGQISGLKRPPFVLDGREMRTGILERNADFSPGGIGQQVYGTARGLRNSWLQGEKNIADKVTTFGNWFKGINRNMANGFLGRAPATSEIPSINYGKHPMVDKLNAIRKQIQIKSKTGTYKCAGTTSEYYGQLNPINMVANVPGSLVAAVTPGWDAADIAREDSSKISPWLNALVPGLASYKSFKRLAQYGRSPLMQKDIVDVTPDSVTEYAPSSMPADVKEKLQQLLNDRDSGISKDDKDSKAFLSIFGGLLPGALASLQNRASETRHSWMLKNPNKANILREIINKYKLNQE